MSRERDAVEEDVLVELSWMRDFRVSVTWFMWDFMAWMVSSTAGVFVCSSLICWNTTNLEEAFFLSLSDLLRLFSKL